MMNAGQVNGGALAAMDFLHRFLMMLERTDADFFAARQPFDLVADREPAGRDRAGDDGSMSLHDEGAVDGETEPLFAESCMGLMGRLSPIGAMKTFDFDLLASLQQRRLQFPEAGPGVR